MKQDVLVVYVVFETGKLFHALGQLVRTRLDGVGGADDSLEVRT